MGSKPIVVAVSGVKNSGKTTLMEKLIVALTARGLRVAAIKHDGHDFVPDAPGTDSWRYGQAGACGYAVFSPRRFQIVREAAVDERELLAAFPDADVVLLEGFKHSPWPKIEVVRAGNSVGPVCDPATLLAVATDLPLTVEGAPVVGLEDIEKLTDLILTLGR